MIRLSHTLVVMFTCTSLLMTACSNSGNDQVDKDVAAEVNFPKMGDVTKQSASEATSSELLEETSVDEIIQDVPSSNVSPASTEAPASAVISVNEVRTSEQ